MEYLPNKRSMVELNKLVVVAGILSSSSFSTMSPSLFLLDYYGSNRSLLLLSCSLGIRSVILPVFTTLVFRCSYL